MTLAVRTITPEEHRAFLREQPSVSFLQTPAWGVVKSDWRSQSIGWVRRSAGQEHGDGGSLAGVGLVLLRKLPGMRRFLAYLPEGPVLDWATDDLGAWLRPMAEHLRGLGCFAVRIGPPVVTRCWDAAAVKEGIADPGVRTLGDLPASATSPTGARVVDQLAALGWRLSAGDGGGFALGQPRYNFQIPLTGRTADDVLAGMNQLWRRNIKKAAKAGVVVSTGSTDGDGSTSTDSLRAFHDLYVRTAERDRFTPRPLAYFEAMFRALNAEQPGRVTLYLACHESDLVAATVAVRVGGHVWYSYGASSTEKREVRGSNAVQWAMIRDALAAGADVYDLRGITDTLDADDPHAGLIQFKVGTGGQAVEYAGEWDLPLQPLLYKAFSIYLSRRPGS